MLIILMGMSSSGKTSIAEELVSRGWHKVVTFTTRPPRPGEVDGVDYYFISDREFKRRIKQGYFLEYKSYTVASGETWYYGSPANLSNMDKQVIILTPSGYKAFLDKSGNIPHKAVYIHRNITSRTKSAIERGDDEYEIARRRKTDLLDFEDVPELADEIIINKDNKTIQDLADEIEEML